MEKLSDNPKIKENISRGTVNNIRSLYKLIFEEDGDRNNRKKLRNFSGFKFNDQSEEYNKKVDYVNQNLTKNELIACYCLLNLSFKDESKEDLIRHLVTRLMDLHLLIEQEDEEEEDEDEDEDEGETKDEEEDEDEGETKDDEEDEDEGGTKDEEEKDETEKDQEPENVDEEGLFSSSKIRRQITKTKKTRCETTKFTLSFRDVEDTIKPYEGKDDYSVESWLKDFEDVADLMGWDDMQKLIFGKKLLRGIARLFIQSERGITTWHALKRKLIAEFAKKVNSAELHRNMSQRKMKKDETVEEYFFNMKELASRGNIEDGALYQCIIDGIDDDFNTKIVLYGARSYKEFKEKLDVYVKIRTKKKVKEDRGRVGRDAS